MVTLAQSSPGDRSARAPQSKTATVMLVWAQPPTERTMETRMTGTGLPLAGVRVVEMTHMVMVPTCGMILAQLGAHVIKVEPPAGDKTRSLGGMGTSFFPLFNRGKRSVVLDFAKEEDRETMDRLLASADVFLENFRDGQLEKQGLGADELRRKYPHLYCWTQGLSIRPLRASPGPRRSRADDVGPRRHDRHQRKTAAGRFVGERHHGRHVRGDLDSRSALPETQRCHGRRYSYRVVRKLPVPGGPAHGRVRDDRREAALDARTRARLADLRYFRDRGRRTHFHRRRHRRPLAEFLPGVLSVGIFGRSQLAHDHGPDSGAVKDHSARDRSDQALQRGRAFGETRPAEYLLLADQPSGRSV